MHPTTGQELQFQPHSFAMLFANVRRNLFFGNAGSLNSVANDGTCDHNFLVTLLGKASQVKSSCLFLHPGGFLSSTFHSFLVSVFLIFLFSTSLICGLSCCSGLFTISLSLNAENHLAVFEMPAAAAYLCVSSFIFYLTVVNSMGSKAIKHSGTTSNTALLVKCFWHDPLPNCCVKWNRTPPTGISDLSQLHALIIRLTYSVLSFASTNMKFKEAIFPEVVSCANAVPLGL